MLTRLRIKNFKKFKNVDIELGQAVVLIGPNNSGKTAALQALTLWDAGVKRWSERRAGHSSARKKVGVAINRRDLISIPVPTANLLWRDLHVREAEKVEGKWTPKYVRIEIVVDGVSGGKEWSCGLEFDYLNEESFYCRPLKRTGADSRMPIPQAAVDAAIAYLPPMSGLADREFIKQQGEIGVLIGQGMTAQVLRNLCYTIYMRAKNLDYPNNTMAARDGLPRTPRTIPPAQDEWESMVGFIDRLFGAQILPPMYVKERSEILMAYREKSGVELDLSCSGRGLQQTLLLLAHLYDNPRTVLLLDEPDAHLEILRQRQTYRLLTEVASQQGSQIVAASHSEVVLNEAAERDVVIAFVGKPHRMDNRGSQVLKALKEIGFEQYYMAQATGWVLYLEGVTDLSILQAFARTLEHKDALAALDRPFVKEVGNVPARVREHFHGLREACPELVGIALFDRLDRELPLDLGVKSMMWRKREIENYLCTESVLLAYARGDDAGDLFSKAEADNRIGVMKSCIAELSDALQKLKGTTPWSPDIKASDEFLDRLFENYFQKLGLPNQMRKSNYHVLARYVRKEDIDPEVVEKLDAIVEVAKRAKPAEE